MRHCKSFNENLDQCFKNGKAQEFRLNKYWNVECDNILRHHDELIREVFNVYSGIPKVPGEAKSMSPVDFERIFLDSELLNDNFA